MSKRIEIPKEFMGVPVSEETLKKTLAPAKAHQGVQTTPAGNVQVNAQINPHDYIQVPQHNIVIAREMGYRGKNWYETLDALAGDGLIMPRIDHFMTHFMNVREAASGEVDLLYADGASVSDIYAKELWAYLSSTDRGNKGICWTWLDVKFSKDSSGKLKLETNHRGKNRHDSYDLEDHAKKDGWVDLEFNSQGIPKDNSSVGDYSQGNNMYFHQPGKERVARFDAGLDKAALYCRGEPAGYYDWLGVFPCAEGTAPKNSGGKK